MRKLVPAYNPLQAPYIEVRATVRLPGETNGIPNIKTETKYQVAPSAKKIATFIVNSIFGSDIVTQTEGLQINWLMPTLGEALELAVYEKESFIGTHRNDGSRLCHGNGSTCRDRRRQMGRYHRQLLQPEHRR